MSPDIIKFLSKIARINIMGTYNFNSDLVEGETGEHIVLDLLKLTYPKAYKREGYFKYYDLIVPEISKTIEVKYDTVVNRTGNYFIETEHGVKDEYGNIVFELSGISTTQSDYWCELDSESIIIIESNTLRYLLREYNPITLSPKGDSLGMKGYLLPKYKLVSSPYALVINRSNEDERINL